MHEATCLLDITLVARLDWKTDPTVLMCDISSLHLLTLDFYNRNVPKNGL